jgi:hypothetical protein
MATSSFRDLEMVCEALGLKVKGTKKGVIYTGTANGKYCRISIHLHSKGKDIPSGTYQSYVKDLGFESDERL